MSREALPMPTRSPSPSALAKSVRARSSSRSIMTRPRRVTRLRLELTGRSGRMSIPSPSWPSRVKARLMAARSGGFRRAREARGDEAAQLAEVDGELPDALGELVGRHGILVHLPAEGDLVGLGQRRHGTGLL